MMEQTNPTKKLEPGIFQGTPIDSSKPVNEDPWTARAIRTMKSDADETIKRQHETSVSIAIAEEKKVALAREKTPYTGQEQPAEMPLLKTRINRIFIVIGLVFIIAAIVLAYIFVLPKFKKSSPTIGGAALDTPSNTSEKQSTSIVEPLAQSIIPAQFEKRFNTTKETPTGLISAINTERKQGTSAGSIKNLYFTEETISGIAEISAVQFFTFVNIQAPEIITRSMEKPFMVGFFGENNGGATPFIIFNVSGYDTGLAGMLEWEDNIPKIFADLFETSLTKSELAPSKFHDIVISGKDARVLEITPSTTVAYAFATPTTIVITESIAALETLLPLAAKK